MHRAQASSFLPSLSPPLSLLFDYRRPVVLTAIAYDLCRLPPSLFLLVSFCTGREGKGRKGRKEGRKEGLNEKWRERERPLKAFSNSLFLPFLLLSSLFSPSIRDLATPFSVFRPESRRLSLSPSCVRGGPSLLLPLSLLRNRSFTAWDQICYKNVSSPSLPPPLLPVRQRDIDSATTSSQP